MIDLGCAALAAPPELMPAARAAAEELPRYLGDAGYHPTGIVELREAVARRLHRPRAADQPRPDHGHQRHAARARPRAAADRAGRAPACSSSRPTYPNALAALSARRARITTHGLDADAGWDADLLLGACGRPRPGWRT